MLIEGIGTESRVKILLMITATTAAKKKVSAMINIAVITTATQILEVSELTQFKNKSNGFTMMLAFLVH